MSPAWAPVDEDDVSPEQRAEELEITREGIQEMLASLMRNCLSKIANNGGKMMYVSGETAEPSTETTGIIEDIVRQQVVEIVSSTFFFADSFCFYPILSLPHDRSVVCCSARCSGCRL